MVTEFGTELQRKNEKIYNYLFCLIYTSGSFILEILPLASVSLPSTVQLTGKSTSVAGKDSVMRRQKTQQLPTKRKLHLEEKPRVLFKIMGSLQQVIHMLQARCV